MMKRILIGLLLLLIMVQLVNAAEVCVVVDYGPESENDPDSECIDIDEGKSGYELLNEIGWNIEWSNYYNKTIFGINYDLGHSPCRINGVGNDLDYSAGKAGETCEYEGEYWSLNWVQDGAWYYSLDRGYDGTPHYETKDGDVVGLAYGPYLTQPEMFIVNITKVYVDGSKQSESKTKSGKIVNVFPGSEVEFKIELENFYDSSTDIEVTGISIIGTIEEIDDGDDIEEEIKDFDLAADRRDTQNLKFKIPFEVEAKDRLLRIEIDAEDDAGIRYSTEFTYDLEIEKENHKLKILNSELDKESYACGENGLLFFNVINIGAKEEDVSLKIENNDLKLSISESFELSNDAFDESSKYEKRFNVRTPSNISSGTYPITILANYGSEKETAVVDLIVKECEKKASSIAAGTEGELGENKGVTNVQNEGGSDQGQTDSVKEIKGGETVSVVEDVGGSIGLLLAIVLGILFVVIVVLLVLFFVFRK